MRRAVKALAATARTAASCWATVSQAALFDLPRAFEDDLDRISSDMSFAPIETLVDCLEAAYGGRIESERPRSRLQ